MPETVSAGSVIPAGVYRCSKCGRTVSVEVEGPLPACPSCGNGEWRTLIGADGSRPDDLGIVE